MKDTPISNSTIPKNKPKGISVTKKNTIPLLNILNKKLDRIAIKLWPATKFANSLTPKDIALEEYEANSINTSNGTKAKGQPSGKNVEKKLNLWIEMASIVNPKKIITLNPKHKTADVVIAKLYEIFPIKLETRTKKNKEYIKGKYISWLLPIWFLTIDKIVT